jgi:hypothetical protein
MPSYRKYVVFFLTKLHEKMCQSDNDSTFNSKDKADSESPYKKAMEACYDSLGRFVTNMKKKPTKDFAVQVNYFFQTISIQTLIPLVEHFLGIPDDCLQPQHLKEPVFKRRREIGLILGRIKEFLNEEFNRNNYNRSNIYLVFSKKNVFRSFEKILKKDMDYSEMFFKDVSGVGVIESSQLQFYYQKRHELMPEISGNGIKLMGLIRDYLRTIDLNYIDASKSYFKEKFTLKDLLKRDKINKKFTKVSHVRMDMDGGPSYSAELAADYIMHKMDEMKEDVTLLIDVDYQYTHLQSVSPETNSILAMGEDPKKRRFSARESEDGIDLELGRKESRKSQGDFYKSNDIITEIINRTANPDCNKIVKFISIISCENRIRLKYYHSLTTYLARSKAQFESRYISPFEITMRFGLEALEKNVAYQFIEKNLAELDNLNIKIEAYEDDIRISYPDDPTGSDLGFSFVERPTAKLSFTKRGSMVIPGVSASAGPKVTVVNTFEDVCNYMKTSKDIVDFTTLGIDRRNFKHALHIILKLVGRGNPS